jgi:hypothetical protein
VLHSKLLLLYFEFSWESLGKRVDDDEHAAASHLLLLLLLLLLPRISLCANPKSSLAKSFSGIISFASLCVSSYGGFHLPPPPPPPPCCGVFARRLFLWHHVRE